MGPRYNHKSFYKREAEGGLTTEEAEGDVTMVGVMPEGVQEASSCWKRQGFSPKSSRRNQPC